MTYANIMPVKVLIAAALAALISSAASAQDGTAYSTQPVTSYEKTAELLVDAPQKPNFKTSQKAATKTASKRLIIRKVLPSHVKSVRTADMGRVFTTRDHAYDAMTIYKPDTQNSENQMPNLYKPHN